MAIGSLPTLAYVSGQGSQECHERTFLLRAEIASPNFRVKVRIWTSALRIELDDILKRRDAAIVHVRSSSGHLAERRCFEVSFTRAEVCQHTVPPRDSRVVEPLVGEVGADDDGNLGCVFHANREPLTVR